MTFEEYRASCMDVAWLAACAVNGTVPDAERAERMDLKLLYKAADHHMLTGITAMALESAGIKDPAFTQARGKAIRKAAAFDLERAMVLGALEEAGIWYMPLKGAVIQSLYPRLGMRQMADNDILADGDRIDDAGKIMEGLGFTRGQDGNVHDTWFKEPVFNFELHHALFSGALHEKLSDYYKDVKDRLIKDQGNRFGYHFSDEDFYIYMTAHEYKHYSVRGTGLRSLLDIWVFCRNKGSDLDWGYITGELRKLGLEDFEAESRSLAFRLFEGDALTGADEDMLDYILSSGTFGNRENFVKNRTMQYGGGIRGRVKYLMRRIFLPMSSIKRVYPFFYRHKILLPFLFIYRMIKGLTAGRRNAEKEMKALLERDK